MPDTVEHLERVISELPSPPTRSATASAARLVQILLDRGLRRGRHRDRRPSPTEGVRGHDAGTALRGLRSRCCTEPRQPPSRGRLHAEAVPPRVHHHARARPTPSGDTTRYHIPAPGGWVWDGALANITPGHQNTWVDYDKPDRAPLLFIAGGKDQIVPAEVNKENAERYQHSGAHTDYMEFGPRPLHDRRAGVGEDRQRRAHVGDRPRAGDPPRRRAARRWLSR